VDGDHDERTGRRLVAVLREPLHERLDSGVAGGRVDDLGRREMLDRAAMESGTD